MLPATGSTMTQAISSPTVGEQLLPPASMSLYGERQRVRGELRRHAGRGRHAERQRARAGLDQQRVGVAVIAAFELHDLVAAGEAARQPDRAHGRFGAGAHHAHQLDRRHQLADAVAPSAFRSASARRRTGRARRAPARRASRPDARGRGSSAPTSRRSRCSGCRRRRRRSAPLARSKNTGSPPTRAERAHRRVHAAGNVAAGIAEKGHGDSEAGR